MKTSEQIHLGQSRHYFKLRAKPKGPKVTIAIGLIRRYRKTPPKQSEGFTELPAIWMASDSQATYGSTKRENPNKINSIEFTNGAILVAQADSVEIGDSVIEKLRQKARQTEMDSPESAIKTVRAALLEVRTELLEWNKGCVIDLEKFFWTEHRLNLLVGYYFNQQPYLYKMDIYRGIPTPVNSFEAIGGGESLGYFLLKEYSKSDPDFSNAMPIAISVVDKVIDNVDGVGRPIWVNNVYPIPGPLLIEKDGKKATNFQCFTGSLPPEDSELVVQELKKSDARLSSIQQNHIISVMRRASKKFVRLFEQERRNKMKKSQQKGS